MRKKILSLTLLLSAISASAGVFNGTPITSLSDSSRVYDLDEVFVISQPKEQFRLRMQPVSSSMFSNTEINSLGVRDLRDLSSYVPSLAMPNYGSRYTSSIYVRGIGSRINSPAIGIYLDGMPLATNSQYNFHTYSIERVDFLRGPQGTLYGMNTEGGMIRLYSKNPLKYQGTDVSLGWGSRSYRNAQIEHFAKLGTRFGISLAGFYNGQNGFLRNQTTGQHADKYNEAGGRFRLAYADGKRWTADLIADYQYVRQNGFPYGIMDIATGETASPSSNRQSNYRRNMLNTGLNLTFRGNYFDFFSTTSYQHLKDYLMLDVDYQPIDLLHVEQRQLQNSLSQELTLKSNRKGAWQWTTGAFGSYLWLKTVAPVYFDYVSTLNIANAIQQQMYNAILASMTASMVNKGMPEAAAAAAAAAAIAKAGGISMSVDMAVPGLFHTPHFNLGLFHESNITLGKFTLTLGLRYDYNHYKVHYDTSAIMAMTANVMGKEATNVLSSVFNGRDDSNFNQLLPKFGISYRLDETGSNIYATVSKGYRAGGFNIQMFSDIMQSELMSNRDKANRGSYDIPHTSEDYDRVNKTISFKPEVSWNYEVGTHLNLFENAVHADLAVYYMQVRNQQLSVMAGNYGFGRMMVNAGKSFSCGVEASLRGKAFDNNMSWAVNYGYTHAAFKEYEDAIVVDGKEVVVKYNDKRIPFVPQHTISALVDYTFPVASTGLRAITIGANTYAHGKIYWNEANSFSQKLYCILGAHIDADLGCVNLSLWGRNLTSTKYNTFASFNNATKQYFAQSGNPFQMGVDLKLHF
ncbi:MAG: TonB-dependent receptor [Prevotella sp.]|uniref:TonB-dependent receptor n=1 Tax=Prevotella sp. TaxID=59823 RepID=UPI002A2AA814|nr:TonB-dependent receptor [Prevotella sp.]MDD7318205.1 TonB-dependent receptor [Prevotellaceae bacterium]MDY4020906.1 TonB-dependent receptor [Prevotella sp.]